MGQQSAVCELRVCSLCRSQMRAWTVPCTKQTANSDEALTVAAGGMLKAAWS